VSLAVITRVDNRGGKVGNFGGGEGVKREAAIPGANPDG